MPVSPFTDLSAYAAAGDQSWRDREEQEIMRLLEKAQATESAADDARWTKDMNSFYAKASQALGKTGYEGAMGQVGIQNREFQELLNQKWFKNINDTIDRIVQLHVATGGTRNAGLMAFLERQLSNPEMSKDIDRFATLDSYIQKGHEQWAALPEWKRAHTQDPALIAYLEEDVDDTGKKTGAMKMKEEYDLYGEHREQAASRLSGLMNIHNPYTMEEFEKELDKMKPSSGTYGVSAKQASKVAMDVYQRLSAEQKQDLNEQALYQSPGYGEYTQLMQKYSKNDDLWKEFQKNLNSDDFIKKLKAKKTPLNEAEQDIYKAWQLKHQSTGQIGAILQSYADKWTAPKDPDHLLYLSDQLQRQRTADAAQYAPQNIVGRNIDQASKSETGVRLNPLTMDVKVGGKYKPAITPVVLSPLSGRGIAQRKLVRLSGKASDQLRVEWNTGRLRDEFGNKASFGSDMAAVNATLLQALRDGYYDTQGHHTGSSKGWNLQGYISTTRLRELNRVLKNTCFKDIKTIDGYKDNDTALAAAFLDQYHKGGASLYKAEFSAKVTKDMSKGKMNSNMVGLTIRTNPITDFDDYEMNESYKGQPEIGKFRDAAISGIQSSSPVVINSGKDEGE